MPPVMWYSRVDKCHRQFIAGYHNEKKICTHYFELKFYRGDKKGKNKVIPENLIAVR